MSLHTQQVRVATLAAQASVNASAMRAHRHALSRWRHEILGQPRTLGWAFAAGAAWGLMRNSGRVKKSPLRRKALAVLNAGWVAYRMLKQNTP